MSLIRWEPFAGSDDIFSRLLQGALPRWSRGDANLEWSPTADISETQDEYLIRAQLPAVKKEDVKVTVDQGVLTLQGERKYKKDDKTEKYHRVESFQGSFIRSFGLPDNANADAIRCESKDGELIVHIPKNAPKTPSAKQIPIT